MVQAPGVRLCQSCRADRVHDDEVQIVRRFLSEEEYEFLMSFSTKLVRDDPYFHIGNHFRDLPE